MVPTYRCSDVVPNLSHLSGVQVRDHMCHSIVMTPLITSICALCRMPTFTVIGFMCFNKIVKNHCSNNDAILSVYMKGWHAFQNFPSILPHSKSSFYDRTK
ncbi:hypothetical protein ACB098_04G105400 [Castanea mollissima]